jgi:16S rRNA (uracil1498-N3)-methyltransferase
MLPRFLAAIDPASGTARLSEEEARHLSLVLRLAAGADIAVFDGEGREFRGRVERVARDGALVRLLEEHQAAPEPSVRVTLAQAALKGEKMDDVVRDATMMGVAALEPLVTDHTAAHMKAGRAPERWRRVAVASAKQCRRAVVPRIGEGTPFAEWIARDTASLRLLLVEPSASVEGHPASTLQGERPAGAVLLIGPEGGWSEREVTTAVAAGYLPITLGRRTLRADAVPIVALGVLQFLWSDL